MTPSFASVNGSRPAEQAKETHDYLATVGTYHQALCHDFKESGRKLFHMTEKAHYAQHIALDCISGRYNPRYAWTYADEDYMGKIAQISQSSSRARGPLRLAQALVFRWRNRVYLRWERRKRKG